ncbi:hypothetical protein P775_23785 [Puniceibacterium antarcticum]|uniref:Uncharacterized protein n=1 Tax=Puniceibacterium antarcticum TaxID=1206336 RepID=A0A2G8R7V6_9RHOB|nr:hypothetical protein P775_23785 [Puniceibacterium antarcticum]
MIHEGIQLMIRWENTAKRRLQNFAPAQDRFLSVLGGSVAVSGLVHLAPPAGLLVPGFPKIRWLGSYVAFDKTIHTYPTKIVN